MVTLYYDSSKITDVQSTLTIRLSLHHLFLLISRASSGNRSPFARVDARTLTFRHGEDLHLERLPGHPAAKRAPLKRDDGKQYLKVRFLHRTSS